MNGKTIPNVPRVAMFVDSQMYLTPFIGSLYAALLGMAEGWSYSDILAMSGAGNRLRWMPGVWEPGNVDIINCEDAHFAPHHRALKAVGWNGEVRLVKPICGATCPLVDESTARREIVSSIDRGVPVIAMGIIGPPECCVVFGYEDGGERLNGWNYFQADEGFDALKPFSKANWFQTLHGYILLKDRIGAPAQRESGLATLRAVVAHARQGEVRGAKVGIAAWEAMLGQLEHDDFSQCTLDFPGGVIGDDSTWQTSVRGRFMVYCDALCQVAERGVALTFYEKLIDDLSLGKSELRAAIEAWKECSTYGGFLWKHLSMDNSGLEKFRKPEVRKILADEGRRCMLKDIEGIERVEDLLKQ